MELDDHLREMLKELGAAINESISGSERVNESIQRIREEGYDLFMVLDAKVGLDPASRQQREPDDLDLFADAEQEAVSFRINLPDVRFLKSVGIDPTRKVKTRARHRPTAVHRSPRVRAISPRRTVRKSR